MKKNKRDKDPIHFLYKENSTDDLKSDSQKNTNKNTSKPKEKIYFEFDDTYIPHEFSNDNNNLANKRDFSTKYKKKKNIIFKYLVIYTVLALIFIYSYNHVKTTYDESDNSSSTTINLSSNDIIAIQKQQLDTFSNSYKDNNLNLDSLNFNLLTGDYTQPKFSATNKFLTKRKAQEILNNICIPFNSESTKFFSYLPGEKNNLMISLSNNLNVTQVITDSKTGTALAKFYFGTKLNNQLITIEGIAIFDYMNGWGYSSMLEQKSIRTYSKLSKDNLLTIFAHYEANNLINFSPESLDISNIKIVNPTTITANISGIGSKYFSDGQINILNDRINDKVVFIKNVNISSTPNYKKIIVASWNVSKITQTGKDNIK